MPSQLIPLSMVSPGRRGLNKEREQELLSPDWCTEASNMVVNRAGRLAARKGFANQTTDDISGTPAIDVLFEYLKKDGTSTIITAANNLIFENIDSYTTAANDITPATTPTGDDWQFINFNGSVLGWQASHAPIVWADSGDFADIVESAGTVPAGNAALAAFGRVWAVDSDKQTIKYCALLDHTDWSTASGGGSIDMSSVWTNGMDEVVAIAALGANFIVFGRNHIVVWQDSQGTELGLDPTALAVVDTVEGTGCIARDSVQAIGEGDLAFLSRNGVQLLGRVIANRSNPVAAATKSIRTHLDALLDVQVTADTSLARVRSLYSPENGFYLLLLPDVPRIICMDVRAFLPDEEGDPVPRITEWNVDNATAMAATTAGDVLFGFTGNVGKYSGTQDMGVAYSVEFFTPWLDLEQGNVPLKILKQISTIVQVTGGPTLSWKWEFDFDGNVITRATTYDQGGQAEYGLAEYNIGEYSGGLSIQRKRIPGRGAGQYIRVGFTASVDGYDLALQQIDLYAKLGRMAA